jgi:hypothetical protein
MNSSMLVRYSPYITGARRGGERAAAGMQKFRCSVCKLVTITSLNACPECLTCRTCPECLKAKYVKDSAADLKARQARRRELKPQLADLLRKHAANRAEIAKKILTFVGFDLPGQ